ncbi:MAG: FAD-dependent oxidoreductase [Clostridia bacterium]|nr:FAD-dependent oxidoreductase [Clostridia bacterium]
MKLNQIHHTADLCVVGGGMAGLCAAVAAARGGSRVILMQERPMLGGNASSEIRMWVCGADGKNNRETGIIEEIALENLWRNPEKRYPLWDVLLLDVARREKNLTLLLNCSCCDAEMDGSRIVSVTGWQMTTQSWHTVRAAYFADCSGDSILAPLTGAAYRVGRESADEFGESVSVTAADRQTMGMSCLMQARFDPHTTSRFVPQPGATQMTPEMIALRRPHMERSSENFWYLELGGNRDSIADTETLRDELIALALGMWDWVKNSGEVEDADHWHLEFLGILPGKRESRRMMGPYIMTQGDVLSGGHFDDVIAYGGWPLDDHHPDGFYHKGNPNTWGKTPAPYGIPYRCLYSANIDNLFFAGRNISMTHAAMSSTRVMATCALLGEAVGTAANIAREFGLTPDGVYREQIALLQARLMENGCFLPGIRRDTSAARAAELTCDGPADALENLRNGADRCNHTYGEADEGCTCPAGATITYRFAPRTVEQVHIAFDSDLDRVTLPGDKCERRHGMRANLLPDAPVMHLPLTLVRAYKLWGLRPDGSRVLLAEDDANRRQIVNAVPGEPLCGLALTLGADYGGNDRLHLFSFDFR